MAEPRQNPRIIVQSDFDEAFREKERAWVTFKKIGEPSVYGDIEIHPLKPAASLQLRASGKFEIKKSSKKSLTISYPVSSGEDYTCRFLSPDVTFSVHPPKTSVPCLDVSQGGLAVSSDLQGSMKVWTTEDGQVRRDLQGHVMDITVCRFFPSGVVVLSGGSDMSLKVWSAETGKCAATFIGHTGGITDAGIVERGRNIVSTSRDGTAKLWDCSQQKCLVTFDEIEAGYINGCSLGEPGTSMELGPYSSPVDKEIGTEGKLLLMACENGSFQGYSLRGRQKVFSLTTDSAAQCCCFVSENIVVTGTENGTLYGLDLRNTSVPLAEVRESRGAITSFIPYKSGFFTSTADGSCFYLTEQLITDLELVGPDCDPVYNVVTDNKYIYTACRDGGIRKYRMEQTL